MRESIFCLLLVVAIGCKKTKLDGEFSSLAGTWELSFHTDIEQKIIYPTHKCCEITFLENGTYESTGRESTEKGRVTVTEPKAWELEAGANYVILLKRTLHKKQRYAVRFPHPDTLMLIFEGMERDTGGNKYVNGYTKK